LAVKRLQIYKEKQKAEPSPHRQTADIFRRTGNY